MRLRKRLIRFVLVVQFILLLAHLFIYQTWTFGAGATDTTEAIWLKAVLGVLSVSFVAASLLAFSHTSAPVRVFYRAAAVWMGFLSFLFLAGVAAWLVFAVATVAHLSLNFHF